MTSGTGDVTNSIVSQRGRVPPVVSRPVGAKVCSKATMRLLATVFLLSAAMRGAEPQSQAASPDFFETKIRPILAGSCYSCHTNSALGGLRLDSREAMLKGGGRGPALVPGDPDRSLLVKAVRQTDAKLKMPMGSRLTDSQIEDIVAWVKAGAVWPAGTAHGRQSRRARNTPLRRSRKPSGRWCR